MSEQVQFSDLKGKTLTAVTVSDDKEQVDLACSDGRKFAMYHCQDCCEHVYVEDIVGDIEDLLGTPILQAEVVTSSDGESDDGPAEGSDESYTWTFYKLRTIKGSVDIRWFGSSNGYYSESVDFVEINQ